MTANLPLPAVFASPIVQRIILKASQDFLSVAVYDRLANHNIDHTPELSAIVSVQDDHVAIRTTATNAVMAILFATDAIPDGTRIEIDGAVVRLYAPTRILFADEVAP